MFALQMFVRKKRKVLARLVALLALGLGGVAAALPRADAHDASRIAIADIGKDRSFLLSPEPLSGERFSAFYALAHR